MSRVIIVSAQEPRCSACGLMQPSILDCWACNVCASRLCNSCAYEDESDGVGSMYCAAHEPNEEPKP